MECVDAVAFVVVAFVEPKQFVNILEKLVKLVEHTFRLRLIFFCNAAARTALPLTSSLPDTGLVGLDVVGSAGRTSFFGVVTPVF